MYRAVLPGETYCHPGWHPDRNLPGWHETEAEALDCARQRVAQGLVV